MPDALFVDPSATTAAVIEVDGRCYARVGGSSNPPDTASVDAEFSTCDDCGPAPCSCPGGLLSAYLVTFTVSRCDGTTDGFCGTYSETVNGSPCNWSFGGLGIAVQLGLANAAQPFQPDCCCWYLSIPPIGLNPVKTTGLTPVGDYGEFVRPICPTEPLTESNQCIAGVVYYLSDVSVS